MERTRLCWLSGARKEREKKATKQNTGVIFFVGPSRSLTVRFRSSSPPTSSLTGFYRVLPGFTGFYWVLLAFTGFYWVLLGFTGFYRVLPVFYWVLPGFTGFYWLLLGFTGFYWLLLGFTGFFWFYLGFTGLAITFGRDLWQPGHLWHLGIPRIPGIGVSFVFWWA